MTDMKAGHFIVVSQSVLQLIVSIGVPGFGVSSPRECHRDIEVLWTTQARSSPAVSSPLIADINGDNVKDVLVTSFGGEVMAVDGETGRFLPGWPVAFIDNTFHAAPLLLDVDNDGMREVIVSSSNGQIIFLHSDGSLIEGEVLQIPPLMMKSGWYRISVEQATNKDNVPTPPTIRSSSRLASPNNFIPVKESMDERSYSQQGRGYYQLWSKHQPGRRPSGPSSDGKWVYVDPHILSTPVIADFSGNGKVNELVVVVNFYFMSDRSEFPGLSLDEMKNFVASGLVVFNLQTKQIVFNVTLEISQQSSQFPAYILALPTFVSSTGILVGTAEGNVFLVRQNQATDLRPLHVMDSIHGQVSFADVNSDGKLELLAVDRSGNVICKELATDGTGTLVWESTLSVGSPAGVRVADIDGDEHLEVIVATTDGYVWIIEADSGKLLPGWPVKLSSAVRAIPLISQLGSGNNSVLDLIVPTLGGGVSVIRGSDACSEVIEINKPTSVAAVAGDLITQSPGLEFVVATDDGTLMCIGHRRKLSNPIESSSLLSWPAETLLCSGTTYYSGKIGIRFTRNTLQTSEVSGRWLSLTFEIIDRWIREEAGERVYHVKISIGQHLVEELTKIYKEPGVYTENIPCPAEPVRAEVIIKLTVRPSLCFEDTHYISFNQNFHWNLPWVLITPTLVMCSVLLVVHGYRPLHTHILPTILPTAYSPGGINS